MTPVQGAVAPYSTYSFPGAVGSLSGRTEEKLVPRLHKFPDSCKDVSSTGSVATSGEEEKVVASVEVASVGWLGGNDSWTVGLATAQRHRQRVTGNKP